MNQLKKKRNLFSIISNIEEFKLMITAIGVCVWVVGTYWFGKLCLYLGEKIFNIPSDFNSDFHLVNCLFTGFMMDVILALIILLMEIFINCIINCINTIKIAKIIQRLPVSIEEIKMLNINSYEPFENFLISLFANRPKNITNETYDMVEHAIFEAIIEYLNIDDTRIRDMPSDGADDPKIKFAKLHSEYMAKYLFKNEEDANE